MNSVADLSIDVSELTWPDSILKVVQLVKALKIESIIEVVDSEYSSLLFDLPEWWIETGNEVISTKEEEGKIKFYLKKCTVN